MKCCCENCGWLSVNPSGAMFCGYSDQRIWRDEWCEAWKDKDEPKTNADRVRAMPDEELAKRIAALMACMDCPLLEKCEREEPRRCIDMWVKWLKSPVELDDGL